MLRFRQLVTLVFILALVVAAIGVSVTAFDEPDEPVHDGDGQIGQQFQVPYRLTDTNHFLVRARINGKGPFNFLVDSGAPALFIATETAAKVGLKPAPTTFWTPVNSLELEGGARLTNIKARIEDPFQLVGMNALGLPGASIDGILGFTILARFRLEIDLTKDRMNWTRLKYDPREPPVPRNQPAAEAGVPVGVQAISALGPLAKGLAFLMGKQPEVKEQARGFLGIEWSEADQNGKAGVFVRKVFHDSPADHGGVHAGDQIVRLNDHPIKTLNDAHASIDDIHGGDRVVMFVDRDSGTEKGSLQLLISVGEGL